MPKTGLTIEQCEAILGQQEMGFLAMSSGGAPYCIPFNFYYEKGCIYIHTGRKGMKWELLAENPRVCFTAAVQGQKISGESPCQYTYYFESVVVRGRASQVTSQKEARSALQKIIDKYKVAPVSPVPEEKFDKVRILRITVDEITGRKNF